MASNKKDDLSNEPKDIPPLPGQLDIEEEVKKITHRYFVSYTQTSNDGRSFGFGNCYISSTGALMSQEVIEKFSETIEELTGYTNVVPMYVVPVNTKA